MPLAGLEVAAAGSDGVQVVRRELDRAIRVDDDVEWDESATYAFGVYRALELLADLIRDGHPDQAIELAEHAIDLLGQAVECVQDDGDTHGCLVWAREIHVRACAAGNPDPMALAQRLFTRATNDDWGVFGNVVADYADVLGPGLPDLRRLAAALHAQLGHHGAAVELTWRDFVVVPSTEGYQRLREYGEADGSWGRWHERALDELRRQPPLATPPPPVKGYQWPRPMGHSVLVNVLLEEGDVQAAWEAAHDGGCLEGVWLTLARQRALAHPRDAIPVFCRQIEAAVDVAKRDGYEHAVSVLTEVSECHERVDASAEFADYVRRLRAAHRRKRNFIAALDTARLPA